MRVLWVRSTTNTILGKSNVESLTKIERYGFDGKFDVVFVGAALLFWAVFVVLSVVYIWYGVLSGDLLCLFKSITMSVFGHFCFHFALCLFRLETVTMPVIRMKREDFDKMVGGDAEAIGVNIQNTDKVAINPTNNSANNSANNAENN